MENLINKNKQKNRIYQNVLNGVNGGYDVDIIILTLQPCRKFNELLPKEMQDILSKISFPLYNTLLPSSDDKTSLMALTQIQANLLLLSQSRPPPRRPITRRNRRSGTSTRRAASPTFTTSTSSNRCCMGL